MLYNLWAFDSRTFSIRIIFFVNYNFNNNNNSNNNNNIIIELLDEERMKEVDQEGYKYLGYFS